MGCSQHRLYVIGADDEQFDQLQKKLKNSGIKVIKQNNLTSEFHQLTLVSALAFPIGKVEAAVEQNIQTTLAHGRNQFYTDSAGLYFPTHTPKMVDIFTNTCNSFSITFTTFQDNFFKLVIEQFAETDQGYEYITKGEHHGTYTFENKTMTATSQGELLFHANGYFENSMQADGLLITTSNIPQINDSCKIIKRKNHK
ncbi:hypothetical protein OS175_00995 [Marinicella sp. S1101]|uniref:hypothetical protein n=1 Tax=Marinicella marina TaxID=2996016 RepID=UPI0022609B40|nr:hypothetical protein [Marinicella marina]MCX7552440.1 hypothetical protein [Marinicella marina]MDJ1139315.1 hypothetical protein [Marinicella marina]